MATEISGGRSAKYQPTITFVPDSPPRQARINLAKASAAELQRALKLSDAVSRKIVAAREERPFRHVEDLVTTGLVTRAVFARIAKLVTLPGGAQPYLYEVATNPKTALKGKAFNLDIAFEDSAAGARVVRLQANSVSHALDLTREVTQAERQAGRITFPLPAMEMGVMNVEVSLYDNAGHKDYLARTLHILHNPPIVDFYPAERSLRLSNGAALKKSDGNFHCDSNFYFYNGTTSSSTISRLMAWRILNQGGGVIESGSWDFGANIVLPAGAVSSGWWFTFTFPPGNATFNRLQAREQIRIEWFFNEVGTGASVSDALTWRAVLGPHVNIIRVGEENFTAAEKTTVFNALRNSVSSIYQQQDMDIGTIRTYIISVAAAGGYVTIDSADEAEELTNDWTVPNDAMDMFVVRNYVGSVAGRSAIDGPCDKNAKGMDGSVVELKTSQALLGVIMAHELGHYLGLSHTSLTDNLMNPSVSSANTLLINSQGNNMKDHCFIRFLG